MEGLLVFTGPLKVGQIKIIPGNAGHINLFPGFGKNKNVEIVHTVLSELRLEDNGELIIEDGVDLLVAESSTSCYLMISGVSRYEV